jgi:predicted MFS family arabinose efflux permease
VLSLSRIRLPFQAEELREVRSLRVEIREGLNWLWHQPVVRAIALLHSGLIFSVSGLTLMLVVIAARQHAAPVVIGLMFGLGGIGSMLGALLGSQAHKRLHLRQIVIGAYWLFALLWPLFALAPSPLVLGAILGVFWIVDEVYDVAQISYRLTLIPDALRGRVNGAFRLVSFSCDTLGVAVLGVLLQQIGVVPTILCFEAALVVLAIASTLNRGLRVARPIAEL